MQTSQTTQIPSTSEIANIPIHIFGAGRGIGRWFASHLFCHHPDVHCYDIESRFLEGLPATVKSYKIESKDDFSSLIFSLKEGGIFLLAIPENSVLPTAKELKRHVPPASLFITCTSVQAPSLNELNSLQLPIKPLGCHPLFGPTVRSPIAQTLVLTNFDLHIGLHSRFERFLKREGLVVSQLSATTHDELMGVVQALTHFCFLTYASVLSEHSNLDDSLLKLRTPNFQFLHAFTCRYLKLTPQTTGSIQHTAAAKKMRALFVEHAARLDKALSESKTVAESARVIESVREPFAGSHVDEGVQVAALAVDSIQRFDETLFRFKVSKDVFLFRHKLTNNIHAVRILEITPVDVEYEEATKKFGEKFVIGLDEMSRTNYKKIGINIPKPGKARIKKRHVTLMTTPEVETFWSLQVLLCEIRMNSQNPQNLPPQFFEKRLPSLVQSVKECKFIEGYISPDGQVKVTLELQFDPRQDLVHLLAATRNAIENYKFDR